MDTIKTLNTETGLWHAPYMALDGEWSAHRTVVPTLTLWLRG